MIEDVIEEIVGIINTFPDIKEIKITSKNRITIFWGDQELQAETFTNSIDLLEWCEENLKSTLDDVKPKNIITALFNRFKKNRNILDFE
jgi:CBS domain containing-hemolysin-like protein